MANCGRRFDAGGGAPATTRRCNLERFLEAATPVVPTTCSSKKSMNGWRQSYTENALPFFTLGDLWDEFRESSAYGVAVPIVLNGCSDGVVQYYVPYLSAIQLYGRFRRHFYHSSYFSTMLNLRNRATIQLLKMAIASRKGNRKTNKSRLESHLKSKMKRRATANTVKTQISSLAKRFPELNTLRSCDLSPTSWMSVAWYPIYRIPSGPTLRDLDACFLTYHPLSTQLAGGIGHNSHDHEKAKGSGVIPVTTAMCLPTFAMASYRLKLAAWASGGRDRQLAASLSQAADAWLGVLRVHHPDHRFFAARRVVSRR
uniref:Uncharacterized protein n=1 Tax=Leersia perrieri TaxID=77586 RepID=A0A0D9UWJ2_9ORYZ